VSDNAPPVLINNFPSLQLFSRLDSLGRYFHLLHKWAIHTNKLGSVTHTFSTGLDVEFQNGCDDLISGRWDPGSNTFREIFQASRNGGLPPLVLPMLHLASNNLLSGKQASDVMDSLLQSGSRSLFNALISAQSPATKAIARSLLPSAIQSLDVPMVRALLDTGISPDSFTTYSRETPLQLAARAGGTEISRLLLHYGAQVNLLCSEGSWSPLTIAARSGATDLVHLLLGCGADVIAPGGIDHTKMTALQEAAEANKLDKVQLLLGAGADVNAPAFGTWGRTALQAAVRTGNIALVQLLLFHGADVNAPAPQFGSTALQVATSAGDLELVQLLLDWGASDILGAMDIASKKGHVQLVQALLRTGQVRGAPSNGAYERMALRAGVRCGDIQFVRHLLEYHTEVDAPAVEDDPEWTTALQVAAWESHKEIAQLLIRVGANVNAPAQGDDGLTALQGATRNGDVDIVKLLLRAGADVNASPSAFGETALTTALLSNHLEIAKLLLESGVNSYDQAQRTLAYAVELVDPFEIVQLLLDRMTEYHDVHFKVCAFSAVETGNIELVRLLLEHGVLDKPGGLRDAIYYSNLELVELLLYYGADVNDNSSCLDEEFPLEIAASSGDLEIMDLLLGHDANAREKARALQAAAYENQVEAARLLISSQADVNAAPMMVVDRPPGTALQAAAGTGNLEMVRLLLEAGADVESKPRDKNEQGTALQFAAISGSISVASVLIENGADVNAPGIGRNGRTALEGAAEHGRLDMVQLLLNVEAEVRGSRAVRLARNEGHDGVVQFLLENGFEDFRVNEAS
jgi:ankyrin repeat protein